MSDELGRKQEVIATKTRFLFLSSLFPPNVIGGAERSAHNHASWLASQGYEVAVVTIAASASDVVNGEIVNGLRTWRIPSPRPYSMLHHQKAKPLAKLLWHLQDHFDPRNRTAIRKIIASYRPDVINIHLIQGIGHNALLEVAASGAAVNFFLHDLGLVCVRASMFKNGLECQGLCLSCKASARWKRWLVGKMPRVGFISPSQANLDTLARYFPIDQYPHRAILNPNKYPDPTIERVASPTLRLLYAGRIHVTKGIGMLLDVVSELAKTKDVSITIAGSGPEEAELRLKYGQEPWCHFAGFLSQEELSNAMVNSDLLCIPSIWAENSPGVVIHALGLGLPVVGSNKGGIPELVKDDLNGVLVEANNRDEWLRQINAVLVDPDRLARWRQYASADTARFNQYTIGKQILAFTRGILSIPKRPLSAQDQGGGDSLSGRTLPGDPH